MGIQDWQVTPQSSTGQAGNRDWSKEFGPPTERKTDTSNMSFGEGVSTALKNTPESAKKFATNVYEGVTHPLDTLGKIGGIGFGEAAKVAQSLGYHGLDDPLAESMAGSLNEKLKQDYGSWEGFKKHMITDPVGTAADLSVVLGGAGTVGKVAGLGDIANTVSKVGAAIDPLNAATKAVTLPLNVARGASRIALGKAAGVPTEFLKEAENVGRFGGKDTKTAFKTAQKGGDEFAAVDAAKASVKKLNEEASNTYTAGKANLSTRQLGVQPIVDKIDEQIGSLGANAAINYPEEVKQLMELRDRATALTDTSAVGLNHFKIGVNDYINDAVKSNKKGLFGQIPQAIKDVIAKEDSTYADLMDMWTSHRNELRNIEDLLGKGDRRSAMSKLAALTKAMAKNQKGAALTALASTKEGRNIRAILAGQATAPWRAGEGTLLQDLIASGGLYAMLGGHPAVALPFLLSSPRLAGNMSYALGKADRYAGTAGKFLGNPAQRDLLARSQELPYTIPAQEQEPQPAPFKRGGRVSSHDADADQLVRAAERAKKGWSAETEPLLNQSDDAVAHALEVANRSI